MIDYLLQSLPFVLALIIYFARLEIRLAKISTDICWIKKELEICPPHLEKRIR